MKTALVTHCWLDNPIPGYSENGKCRRLERWLLHYGGDTWPTYVLDNGSDPETCKYAEMLYGVKVFNLQPHYVRGGIQGIDHDYPNVWRAYWFIKQLLTEYDRVFYIATDAYVLSQRLIDYLDDSRTGWTALWCPEYRCPEAQIQVINKDCQEFQDFFSGPCDPFKYNLLHEEITLPFTHVEKGFIGDRYGEHLPHPPFIPYDPKMDYYTQVPDHQDWDDSHFPVVYRQPSGRLMVK